MVCGGCFANRDDSVEVMNSRKVWIDGERV
jgi:hypothetical protein